MSNISFHNCIRAILIALCMALLMAAPILVWDEVYADTAGQPTEQYEMPDENTPVFGIYVIPGEDGDTYIEWLGDGQLPEDAVLIIEKKEEMTDEESEQYNMTWDELIGEPEEDENDTPMRRSSGGTNVGDDMDTDGSDAVGDGSDTEGTGGDDGDIDPNADGEEEEKPDAVIPDDGENANEDEDTGTDEKDPDDPAKADAQPNGPAGDAQASDFKGKNPLLAAPAQQTRDADSTRDIIPTGVFSGSSTGMILIVILVAFAAAVIIRRTRREERYTDDI